MLAFSRNFEARRNVAESGLSIHFKATYDEFPDLPIWAAVETMTFGSMFTLFAMSEKKVQKNVARKYGIAGPVLYSLAANVELRSKHLRASCAAVEQRARDQTHGARR